MFRIRPILLFTVLVGWVVLVLGAALSVAQEDLEELGDATAKRGEVLKDLGKALRDRLRGKDASHELDKAHEQEADMGSARDPLAGTGRESMVSISAVDARGLLEDPDRWMGRALRLQAEVQDVISPRAFTLVTGLEGPGSDLLVLSAVPLAGLRIEDGRWDLKPDQIIVVGTLQVAQPAALEPALGWSLPPDLAQAVDGKIVLVARALLDARSM